MVESANPTRAPAEALPPGARALESDALLKLVLDEDRLAILGLTARRPYTVREMAAALPGKRTADATRAMAAKHVLQLLEAGLLTEVGAEHYALNVRQLQQWKRELFARPAAPAPESTEDELLAKFVRAGKLAQYPAQHSKREVVLRWLASHFEPGRAYPEREVNEILSGHCEDHATLRRYLVDWEFLMRQEGVYQRTNEE